MEALDLDPGLTERLRRRMATGEEDDAAAGGGIGAALRGDGDCAVLGGTSVISISLSERSKFTSLRWCDNIVQRAH